MENPADILGAGFTALVPLWPVLLRLLANLLLLSGADDFVPFLFCASQWLKDKFADPYKPVVLGLPDGDRPIAIFVPCWRESDVIANMVRHNLAAIRYRNYDFILGVYPNDLETLSVVEELSRAYRNVHVSVCPHSGPTSKADCLNWIYHRMTLIEAERAVPFDTVVLHDAEDLIHPEALSTINCERVRHAMVQVPVLPLPTPINEFTHGVYCDEFAEFQMIDMRSRGYSGSFTPSNGVGTGFARHILQQLGDDRGQVFDPVSLTEDYEVGVYIHRMGHSQIFVPLRQVKDDLVATREYFPRKVRSAIRQRTRWVTGIALQGWERDGWRGPLATKYWFWRDRKGLVTNPLSLLTNVLFLVGLLDALQSNVLHRACVFAVTDPEILRLCFWTSALQVFRLAIRMFCVRKVYGTRFALAVPLRTFHGNYLNCCASLCAIRNFLLGKIRRKPLAWLKTDHSYPQRGAVRTESRELQDVLIGSGLISEDSLTFMKTHIRRNDDLADYLVASRAMSEDDLCRALSLQSGLPSARVDVQEVKPRIVRSLPAALQKRLGIVPYRVESGRLLVAGTRVPADELFEELRPYTRLTIEYQLVTQRNFDQLLTLQ